MKNKIINTLIIIWAIVITVYVGNGIYNNIMISRTNENAFLSSNVDINNIDLEAKVLNENETSLRAVIEDINQDNVFLVIFSPKCEACVNEIDALNTLYKQNKLKKEPILIGIGDYQNIKDYIEDKKISFQYFSIDKENYQKSFKYDAVPLTLVVNNKGEVLFSKVGWGESETLINSFVKKVNAYN